MKTRLEKKHPLSIRWFHWVNFPVLFVMIWSGLLIYGASRVYRIGIGDWTLYAFDTKFAERLNLRYRLAEGLSWHFTFMWIFAINGLLYVAYLAFSREWKHLLPTRATLKDAWHVILHDLRLSKKPLAPHPIRRARFQNSFDGHTSRQSLVLGDEDFTQTASSMRFDNPIAHHAIDHRILRQ